MSNAPEPRAQEILAAALDLFRKRGFHGASVDDIAEAAGGLTGPAVYRHYADKEHLLAACHQVLLDRVIAERSRHDPLSALVRGCIREPEAMAVYYAERINLGSSGAELIREREAQAGEVVRSVFGPTQGDASVRMRTHAAAAMLTRLGLVQGPRSSSARERWARSMVDAIRNAHFPPAEPSAPPPMHPLRHATVRERILAAAPALFRSSGSAAVSLRQIGSAVGVSSAAVSSHFSSKEQLLYEVIHRGGEAIALCLSRALRSTDNPGQALEEMVRGYVDLAVDSRDTFVVTARELWALTPEHREIRIRQQRMYVAELAALLSATDPGLSQVEARVRAGAVFASVNGAARAFPSPSVPDREWVLAIAMALVGPPE